MVEEKTIKVENNKARILVVESEESLQRLLSQVLKRLKYKVSIASSGEEGLAFFNRGAYDMVLTDLNMPSMDGWTLASRIKEKSPNTPICLITGCDEKEIVPKIKESAVDYVIFKPFRFEELKHKIERISNDTKDSGPSAPNLNGKGR